MENTNWYDRLLNIKKDERKAVFLLMTFSFFVGLSLSFYFTASNAIFLKHFPSRVISLSYMASGVVVYIAWLVLSKIDHKLSVPRQLALKFIFVFTTVLLISFWVWIYDSPASAFTMFTWIRVLVYITLITFWGMAGKIFNIRQGKRVFGLIGIGEVVSILIGYFSIPFILKILKAKDLLFLSSGGLLICLVFALIILRSFHDRLIDSPTASPTGKTLKKSKDINYFKLLKQPYFRLISIMAFLPIFGYLFIDFLFLDQTKHEFANNPEMISGFLGLFLGFTAFIELIFKLMSGRFLSRYGLKPSLIALPAILLFSIVLAAFFGTLYGTLGLFFALIAFARLFERAIRGSIYEPAFQLLYQPVQEDQRLVFQNQIEGIPKALATILTGGVIYLLSSIKILNIVHFNYFLILILGLWIWAAINMYVEYRSIIRAKLAGMRNTLTSAEEKPRNQISEPLSTETESFKNNFEELNVMVASNEPGIRVEAARQLALTGRYNAYKLLQTLLNDDNPVVKKAAITSSGQIKRFELWSHIIENIASSAYGNTAVLASISIGESILPEVDRYFSKIEDNKEGCLRIIRIYRQTGGDLAIKYLRNKINHPDKDIRYNVLLALSDLEYQASSNEIPAIKQTIDELAEAMVWFIASWFDVDSKEGIDNLQKALNQEIDEKKESIFLLLSLIFDSKTIRYIREHIEGKDSRARMYAMEVCDMTVSADIKDLVLSMFDDISQKEKLERFNSQYPQQQLNRKDRLFDIINKDYGKVNKWTKACAIEMLSTVDEDAQFSIKQILAANIVNPDLLIAETSAHQLKLRYPDHFAELVETLDPVLSSAFKTLLLSQTDLMSTTGLILEKVRFLKKSVLFNSFSEQLLTVIAMQWNEMPSASSEIFKLYENAKAILWINVEDLKEFLLGYNILKPELEIQKMLQMNNVTNE